MNAGRSRRGRGAPIAGSTRQYPAFGVYSEAAQANELLRLHPDPAASESAGAEQGKVALARIIDALPAMVWCSRLDGSVEYVNRYWFDYTGLNERSAEGLDYSAVFHPDDRERILSRSAEIRAGDQPGEIEGSLRRHDGVYRRFLFHVVPLRDAAGNVIRWCGTNTDIESLKELEAKLESALRTARHSESHLQKILDTIPTLVWSSGRDGKLDYLNQRWADYTGQALEIARGDGWIGAVHPEDLPQLLAARDQAVAFGQSGAGEARLRARDGKYRWFMFKAAPLRDESGSLLGWYGISTDIERLKRTEEQLRQEQQRLSRIVDSIPNMIFTMDPNGLPLYANEHAVEFFGLSRYPDISLDEMRRLRVNPEDAERLRERRQQALARGLSFQLEWRYRPKEDEEYRWLLFHYKPYRDEQGKLQCWYVTATDIDAVKRAEERLQQEEVKLRRIVDSIPTMILTLDTRGQPIYANQQTLDFLGVDRTADIAVKDLRLQGIHPEDLESLREPRQQALARGAPFQIEQRFRTRSGDYRWFLVRYNPFRDGNERLLCWYATATDIDSLKQTEAKLRRSEKELGELADAIPHIVLSLDAHGELVYANQQMFDFTGTRRDTFSLAEFRHRLVHPDDIERVARERQAGFAAGVPFDFEQRLLAKDGQYCWFLIRSIPVHDEQGRLLRWYTTGTDIDSRKKSEEKLRQSEHALRRIIDAIPNLIMQQDLDGTPVYANQPVLDFAGLTRQQFSVADIRRMVMHPADLETSRQARLEGFARRAPFAIEVRLRRRDAQYCWFLIRYRPFHDEQGRLTCWYSCATDIDSLKQTEAKLRLQEHKLRRVADCIANTVFALDPGGNLVYANQTAREYTGYAEEEVPPDLRRRITPPADFARLTARRQAALERAEPWETEQRLRRHDGQYRWFLLRYTPLRDERGQVLQWYITGTDIEDLKQTEQQLQSALAVSQGSELGLQTILNTMPVLAWSALTDGRNEFANRQWLDYTGLSADQVRDQGFGEAFHPEDRSAVLAEYLALTAAGQPAEMRLRLRRHDGVFRWFLVRFAPLRDESGGIVKWYGTNTDIDDLTQAQERLTLSERKLQEALALSQRAELDLQKAFNTIPVHAWSAWPDGSNDFNNQPVLEYTGLSREQMTDSAFFELLHPDCRQAVSDAWQASLASGTPGAVEMRCRRHDGIYRTFLNRWAPLRDEGGKILKWYGTNTDIEELKQAEERLRLSELELRRITDHMAQLVVTLHPDGECFTYANRNMRDYTGLTMHELLQPNCRAAFIHPDDAQDTAQARAAGLPRGEPFECEYRIRRHDGQYRWFLVRYVPFRDERGELLRWYVSATDIDTLRQTQEQLRREQLELRRITDHMAQMVTTQDAEGGFIYANSVVHDYTGLTVEEASLPDFRARIIHPDDLESASSARRSGLARAEPFEFEHRLRRRDGVYRWFLIRYNPVRDEHGKLVRWYATATDIEDLKNTEQRLRQEQNELRRITDLMPQIVTTYDADGKLIHANQVTRDFTGLTTEELFTVNFREQLAAPGEAPKIRAQRQNGLASGKPFGYEQLYRRKDGQYRWLLVRYIPLHDEQGRLLRWYATATDIDDLKRTEERLRQGERELREVTDAIPHLIITFDAADQMLYANQGMVDYTGLSMEQLFSSDFRRQLIHPDDLANARRERLEGLATGQPFEFSHRILGKDGRYRWFMLRYRPLHDEQGRLVRWYATATDIDTLKQQEDKLRASESELRHITDAIPQLIVTMTPEGVPFYVNQTTIDYTGVDPEDLQRFREVTTHPEDLESLRAARAAGFASGKAFDVEQRIRAHSGEYRWFLIRYQPFRDQQGQLLRWYATATDIDTRRRNEARTQGENIALREEVAAQFDDIVGASGSLRRVLAQVEKVAATDSTVLITGESGTGKELIARAIHKRSQRANGAFIKINLAAIAPSLLASELFGHEKGAFTGAQQRRLGRFEAADGGTLFLDEVGELPPETQVALLRVLQEREFERVGGTQTVRVNVRVLAATNKDLPAAVSRGTFRQDLFYRLNVFPIPLPPLRERLEDIPLLVEHLIRRCAQKSGKRICKIGKDALQVLRAYDWPGNIRELQNVVERAVVLCEGDTFVVDESWLVRSVPAASGTGAQLTRNLLEREREMIENALRETRGVVGGSAGAAAKLGLPRQTLESKMRKLGINRLRFKGE